MAVFSPGDRPPGGRLYLIADGVAIHKLFQFLSVGDCWGDEDVLLGDGTGRKNRETKSMTYLRVIWIARESFRALEDDFPEPYRKMRTYAIWKKARRILKLAVTKQKAADKRAAQAGLADPDQPMTGAEWQSAVLSRVSRTGSVSGASSPSNSFKKPVPATEVAGGTSQLAAAAAGAALDGGGGGDGGAAVEELLQAIDVIGGVLLENRRIADERHADLVEMVYRQGEDVAAVGEMAHAANASAVALSAQLDTMGLVPSSPVSAIVESGENGRRARKSPNGGPRNGVHAPNGREPMGARSPAQIQQSARTRAAFRAMRAEKYNQANQ